MMVQSVNDARLTDDQRRWSVLSAKNRQNTGKRLLHDFSVDATIDLPIQ